MEIQDGSAKFKIKTISGREDIPTTGGWSNAGNTVPVIRKSDGSMEVGRIIDLHTRADDNSDYTVRLDASSGTFNVSRVNGAGSNVPNITPSYNRDPDFDDLDRGIYIPTVINKGYTGIHSLEEILTFLLNNCHTHSKHLLYTDCDCDCDCCSCFPRGTLIAIITDKNTIDYIPIESIPIGIKAIGLNGKINEVIGVRKIKLGKQRTLMTFPDHSLQFSSEHLFWIDTSERQMWGTADYNTHCREHANDTGPFKDEKVHVITGKIPYLTLEGWKENIPIVAEDFDENTELYDLDVDGNKTFTANGYLVNSYVTHHDFTLYED